MGLMRMKENRSGKRDQLPEERQDKREEAGACVLCSCVSIGWCVCV